MTNSVGLIGLGNAGAALATAFSGQCELSGYDTNSARRQAVSPLDEGRLQKDLETLLTSDLLYQRGSGLRTAYQF